MQQQDWTKRLRSIRRVLVRVMLLNLAVAVAKLAVGAATGALSILADGFHSMLDAASNVVGLVGITAAARPPDDDHPYGHHKIETLTSLIIGTLVLFTAVELVQEAVHRLVHRGRPEVGPLSAAVMVVTMGINFGVSTYEAKQARIHGSDVLLADSLQTRSDIFVSGGVLAAMVFIWLGLPVLDPVAALVVTAAILYSAWTIFLRAGHVLGDRTFLEPGLVEEAALRVHGVQSVEKIRSRGTEERLSVDLHVRVDPDISITEAHRITHDVRRAVEEATGAHDVIIHTEPG